jgi:hypothetical protein
VTEAVPASPLFFVETGVPMPPPPSGPSRRKHPPQRWMYPWLIMDIADSFYVPANGRDVSLVRKDIQNIMRKHKRLGTRKFEARVVEGGVRVWRTA